MATSGDVEKRYKKKQNIYKIKTTQQNKQKTKNKTKNKKNKTKTTHQNNQKAKSGQKLCLIHLV